MGSQWTEMECEYQIEIGYSRGLRPGICIRILTTLPLPSRLIPPSL
jgi:hypothetical protein